MSRTQSLWRAFVALVVFLYLPMLFLRLLLGMAVSQDEKLRLDECQDLLKTEMQAYLLDAVPEIQIRDAVNDVIGDMPVERSKGVTRRWAEELRQRLRVRMPCRFHDFWVFGKDLEPLLIEETARHMAEKARYFWAYLVQIWDFVESPAKEDVKSFLDALQYNQGVGRYLTERFVRYCSDRKGSDSIMSSRTFTRMWSESITPWYLRRKFMIPSPLDRPRLLNPPESILTTSGRTHFLFVKFSDPDTGRPLGGFLLTIPEKELSLEWILKGAARQSRSSDCRRIFDRADRRRQERVFQPTRTGYLLIDWPRNHPEYHLGVFVPKQWTQHPARRYLSLLNILLVAVLLVTLFFLREITRWQEEMPLRIFGQLNLALSLSALLPLAGFLLVAWSYSSFHYAQERRMTKRRVEERMQFIDAEIRGYREKLIQTYRSCRDTIQVEYLDRLQDAGTVLNQVIKSRQASDYILHLTDGRVFTTFSGDNPLVNFARAIPKRILMALPIEQPETGTSGAEMRESLKDEIIMKAIEENVPGLITSLDKQFLVSVSARENTTIYLDYITDPRREQPIVGVIAFFLATDNFMQNFFGNHFFKKPINQATVGLDRVRAIKIDNDATYVFPAGERLTPREQEIFEFCRDTRKPIIWDDLDSDIPWFHGAQFVTVVGFDGQTIVQNHRILIAGITFGAFYALLVFFLTTRFLSLRFAEPLLKLRAAAESVEQQNYTIRVEIPGRDEFNELAGVFNRMVKGLYERQQMSRFVSGDVMEAVERGDDATREVSRITVSVLFSDIRGFTELSEKVDAAEMVRMLNAYFTAMETCIVDQGGRIDKYVGDAIMAVFRDVADREPHPLRCARAALAMREALRAFNRDRQFAGQFTIKTGIGINTGEVISGPLGSLSGRLDYTVIGDTVNTAARLEKESKQANRSGIVISPVTLAAIGSRAVAQPLGEVALKGKEKPMTVYELLDIRDGA